MGCGNDSVLGKKTQIDDGEKGIWKVNIPENPVKPDTFNRSLVSE